MMERRRLLSIMAGGTESLKYIRTITVTEDHLSDNTGGTLWDWKDYCNLIIDSNTDKAYILLFVGNRAAEQYQTDFIMYFYGTNITAFNARSNYTNSGTTTGETAMRARSLWATQGTKIELYEVDKNI